MSGNGFLFLSQRSSEHEAAEAPLLGAKTAMSPPLGLIIVYQ
jgi:hypothetical protein